MKQLEPPRLAGWALNHLTPPDRNEALAGDLLEEFCAGRSAAWYWRQVLSAISIGGVRELRMQRTVLLFAALWAMLAPAWLLTIAHIEQFAHLSHLFAQLNWPWNKLSSFALILAINLVFLWSGIVLYLLPELWRNGKLSVYPLARGIAASLPVLLVLWLALIVLPMRFIATNTAQRNANPMHSSAATEAATPRDGNIWARYDRQLDLRQSEMRNSAHAAAAALPSDNAIDLRPSTMLARLPFFLVVLCTLWSSAQRNRLRDERITAS